MIRITRVRGLIGPPWLVSVSFAKRAHGSREALNMRRALYGIPAAIIVAILLAVTRAAAN